MKTSNQLQHVIEKAIRMVTIDIKWIAQGRGARNETYKSMTIGDELEVETT